MRSLILIIISLALTGACQRQADHLTVINGLTMGTTYTVKLVTADPLMEENLRTDIETLLDDINQHMSTYIDHSELSRLNQSVTATCQPVSEDLFLVIKHAHRVSEMTDGAFDITVGPLVNLWGFGPGTSNSTVPSGQAIAKTKAHTGYQNIQLDETARCLRKSDPDIYMDLSGIAKGFAVDRIADYLSYAGFTHYLVDIGGEILARGKNDQHQIWRIGIEQPDTATRMARRIIRLDETAMATSGDYRNYFEKDGVRYSHTIDPVTGKPITHTLASVTVLDDSAMHADALATAFMVAGPEKTLAIADRLHVPVYLLVKTDAGFEEIYNRHFAPFLAE